MGAICNTFILFIITIVLGLSQGVDVPVNVPIFIQHVQTKRYIAADLGTVKCRKFAGKFEITKSATKSGEYYFTSLAEVGKVFDIKGGCGYGNSLILYSRNFGTNQRFIINDDKSIKSACEGAFALGLQDGRLKVVNPNNSTNQFNFIQVV
ncbi:uncharacterized protein LOC132704980 [Cylas formicarius]|uniref:uncharacterized protein LOC132704980 n=1 Tax=Cylas formicarius TaxID=197179 RepID=UPI002958A2BA|nr:uncharacterized protein LOC132704980 [Cylas formicarius]